MEKALSLLADINWALATKTGAKLTDGVLRTSDSRRVIDGLLDLISLEGIYPCLLPGVGVPIERRVKSISQSGVVSRPHGPAADPERCSAMLQSIVDTLHGIMIGGQRGVCIALRERNLVDLIAAEAQLSFAPNAQAPHTSSTLFSELMTRFGFSSKSFVESQTSDGGVCGEWPITDVLQDIT